MSTAEITIEQILTLARTLKPQEQTQLMSRLELALKKDSATVEQEAPPTHRSLRGLLADLGPAPSAEDIDEARHEMWGNFPREDF